MNAASVRFRVVLFGISFAVAALFVAWLFWPNPQWVPEPIAGLEMRCFEETQPLPYSFCINRVPGSENPDVVFHFHGRHGAATWWNDATYYTGAVERRWAEMKVDAPTVVGVSFGRVWLITDDLLGVFLETVLPRIERELRQPYGRRMVVGESMGGVNALLVGLRSATRFSKVASLCAALATVSPYASIKDIISYVHRSSTTWQKALTLLMLSRQFYPNEDFWRANYPLPLSNTVDVSEGPAFYVSCGKTDEWGCTEGGEKLVENLRMRGGRVSWVATPGGHCDIDVNSLASFLTE